MSGGPPRMPSFGQWLDRKEHPEKCCDWDEELKAEIREGKVIKRYEKWVYIKVKVILLFRRIRSWILQAV